MTQKSPNEIQVLYRIFHSFSNFMSKLPKKVGEKHSKSPKICQILRKKIEFHSKFFQKTYEFHPENVHQKSWGFEVSKPRRYTSLRLIYCTESTADSKKTRPAMKIMKVVSKTPTNPPMISKIFRVYTYPLIEISTEIDPHDIIEYHIFCSIYPYLGRFLAKNWF